MSSAGSYFFFYPLQRFVYQSRPWNTGARPLLFLDIQPHFGCDLPLSSLQQLLLMPVSGLRQDGPPDGSSCSSLPKDQITSISAAKIRCEIKYWIMVVCFFWEASHKNKEKKKASPGCFFLPKLGLLVVKTLNGTVLRQTATFVVQIQKAYANCSDFCVKTNPDILFCLFGLIRTGPRGGQMQLRAHTAVRRQIWPRKCNHKSLCWGLFNKGGVYYQVQDVYC